MGAVKKVINCWSYEGGRSPCFSDMAQGLRSQISSAVATDEISARQEHERLPASLKHEPRTQLETKIKSAPYDVHQGGDPHRFPFYGRSAKEKRRHSTGDHRAAMAPKPRETEQLSDGTGTTHHASNNLTANRIAVRNHGPSQPLSSAHPDRAGPLQLSHYTQAPRDETPQTPDARS